MSADMEIHEYKDREFPGGTAIIGFPSVGLVSSIASSFIVKNLDLERVAGVISPEFPPYTLVHQGVPSPPIRIYAGERMCDESGEQCDNLVVVTAEFMPKADLIKPLADMILNWLNEKGVQTIITMEGINSGVDPEEAKTLCVATGDKCAKMVEQYELESMSEGMVSGMSGVLLYEADRKGLEVMSLLGPAKTNFPDARGAARLLEKIGKMFPELDLDPDPLYKEAEQIERQMKNAMESVQQQQPQKQLSESSMIYG